MIAEYNFGSPFWSIEESTEIEMVPRSYKTL